MVDRFRVVPAAYVFLRRGDEVLLQLRRDTGYYDDHWAAGAAGHVEQYESVFDAARREASEELGISVASADLLPLTAMHRTHPGHAPIDERVDFFFTARAWSGEPRVVEPEKAASLQWAPLADLPGPVVPHERSVLAGLRTGIMTPYSTFGFEEHT